VAPDNGKGGSWSSVVFGSEYTGTWPTWGSGGEDLSLATRECSLERRAVQLCRLSLSLSLKRRGRDNTADVEEGTGIFTVQISTQYIYTEQESKYFAY
jgi:hypothetical protein